MIKTFASLAVTLWMIASGVFALNGGMTGSAVNAAFAAGERAGITLPYDARAIVKRVADGVDGIGSCIIHRNGCPTAAGVQSVMIEAQEAGWRRSFGFGMPLMDVNRALVRVAGTGTGGGGRPSLTDVPLPFQDLVRTVTSISRF